MVSLGPLAFAAPWVLTAAVVLPLLWWLLKVVPPTPRLVRFPPVRLLLALSTREETPARTPLWLILLRMTLAAVLIVGLAHPLLNPGAALTGSGPLVLVVDDGWAAARDWPARQTLTANLIDQAERQGRPVILLPTAPPATGEPVAASGLLRPDEARSLAQALRPKPWPSDRAAAMAAADLASPKRSLGFAKASALDLPGPASVVWLSDGLGTGPATAFAERLQRLGRLEVVSDEGGTPHLMRPPATEHGAFTLNVVRGDAGPEETLWVRAVDDEGHFLGRQAVRFAAGATTAEAALDLPLELRNRIAQLRIEDETTAGAVMLLDERWRRRPVGLLSTSALESGLPLLSELYYLERALAPFSEVSKGPVEELLRRRLAVLVLSDSASLVGREREAVEAWMRNGGLVLRFAGPRLAQDAGALIPVRLRQGGRALGGIMSWAQPARLAPFGAASPFAGLTVPDDVRIRRQVLAEPTLDLGDKTWARLTDGTPLVTGARRGEGWLVLVHTTANTDWSNLALSGLFVEMLERIVALSQGVAGEAGERPLPPLMTVDGFGRLGTPPATAVALSAGDFATAPVGPGHPPGYYGSESGRRALNLSATVGRPTPLATPAGTARGVYGTDRETDLKPWLLAAALALALFDVAVSLVLRGLLPLARPARRATAAVLVAGSLAVAAPAAAQVRDRGVDDADAFALAATLETRLAYVQSGDPAVDDITRAGLRGLTAVLHRRTSVELAEPLALDVESDELIFFPLIYWPVTAEQPRPSTGAVARLNKYLETGGILVLDTRDHYVAGADGATAGPGQQRLRALVDGLNIPPLTPVPPSHVLTKSFYLLQAFPGRWVGGQVWVEQAGARVNDGVSSVVIGSNDWVGAWAVDPDLRPLLPVVPGGETQRERAYRFGVNLVMYALTGNYKADQVHVPAILERLGQ